MNDIEKQIEEIEDDFDNKDELREDENIKHKLNRNRDDDKKKKIIMYVIIGVLLVILSFLLVFIFLNREPVDNNDDNDNEVGEFDNDQDDEPVDNTEPSNIGYVSCDDNTALLNVRNSTNGNIIDGLSCYKEVTIEEELGGTETCDNWYKISYVKNGNNYTGYSCGTYIKRLELSKSTLDNVRNLIDKANDYYENNVLKAYCGITTGSKTIDFGDNMTGEYVKSQYKTIDELKNYLLSFLDEDLLTIELKLSDVNNPKIYDNYYEIDGNLYCRNYSGKGWLTYYTGNYDVEIVNATDDKTNINIAYEYLSPDSDCDLDDLSKCSKSDFVYEIGDITIENNIITKIDFHK